MKLLKEEPKGDTYIELIKCAITTSDAFMFFTCDYGGLIEYNKTKIDAFIKDLQPLLIKVRHNGERSTKWPGSESLDNRFQRNFINF